MRLKTSRFLVTALLGIIFIFTSAVEAQSEASGATETKLAEQFDFRGVWVSRYNWSEPEDIAPIIERCAELGFTDIIWQVRGEATALYRSQIEPWHPRLLDREKWLIDPLREATELAHAKNIRLHAWINTMPGWRGDEPPEDPRQLWTAQPGWFMGKRDWSRPEGLGSKPPLLGPGYHFLDPTHPGVQRHIASVVRDIAARYEVDGIHFDYIRYPGPEWGYNAGTIARFGDNPHTHPGKWNNWRREQLTELLRQATEAIWSTRPEVLVSAATWGNAEDGYHRFMQDQFRWMGEGLLDFSTPMIYTTDPDSLGILSGHILANSRSRLSFPGLGFWLMENEPTLLEKELNVLAQRWARGFTIFDFSVFGDTKLDPAADFLSTTFSAPESRTLPPYFQGLIDARSTEGVDWRAPFIDQFLSSSPVFPIGKDYRMGARISDESGVGIAHIQTGSEARAFAEGPLKPNEKYDFPAYSDPDKPVALFVSDPLPGPNNLDSFSIWSYACDKSDLKNEAYSGVTLVRPVMPQSLYEAKALFGRPIEGPQYPLSVGKRLWVSAEGEDALLVFNDRGREVGFSPIRTGLDHKHRVVQVSAPSSLALDAEGNILALSAGKITQPNDATTSPSLILRFKQDGEPLAAIPLPFFASSFAQDADGNLYVTEAYRRRWHLFSPKGEALTDEPFGAFGVGTASREAPSLYRGISVSPDGTRVYVGNPTNRRIDEYRAEAGSQDFTFVKEPFADAGWLSGAIQHAPGDLGGIWVSDSDHFVRVYDETGTVLGDIWADDPALRFPRGMAFMPNTEFVIVAAHGASERVGHLILFQRPGTSRGLDPFVTEEEATARAKPTPIPAPTSAPAPEVSAPDSASDPDETAPLEDEELTTKTQSH